MQMWSWITSSKRAVVALFWAGAGAGAGSGSGARVRACACACGAALVVGCAGKGASFDDAGPVLTASCAACHATEQVDALLTAVGLLDDGSFSAAAFPDTDFPAGLHDDTTADLRQAADPEADALLPETTAQRKAWVLHELHELQGFLAEDTPPDFSDQAHFDAFVTLGEDGRYEGCEVGEKLDLGHAGDPEGMPPRWSPKLFELLGRSADLEPLEDSGRQAIHDYVDSLLPGGGLSSCVPGEDSAS